jgi:hypothetical protein
MESNINLCPKCGQIVSDVQSFCTYCGCSLRETPQVNSAFNSLKSRFTSAKDSSLFKASSVKEMAAGFVSREKTSEAIQKMMQVVTYVAQDMKKGMSSEMVKAVTVSARMSFVAFSIGVSIPLEKLPSRTENV